ncbi:Aste57867_19959 [Aphanomyces stellatus]|uniref:Aste57867_19959 protein n=1 Tax=Aphanomyces stellatus TaxID=120398 RepID=A0A485LFD3_9STRA|nr:hypothetical protein As57867_019893 [Aphanomyces stellatus]VFT96656.1 Aste57867_19959 [Aphanomyces stellatus]
MAPKLLYRVQHLKDKREWVESSRRSHCIICTKRFFVVGKHHCRRCGDVMCKDCSIFALAEVPGVGRVKVRACRVCHEKDLLVQDLHAPLSSSEDDELEEDLLKKSEAMCLSPPRHAGLSTKKSDRSLAEDDDRTTVQSYVSNSSHSSSRRGESPDVMPKERHL